MCGDRDVFDYAHYVGELQINVLDMILLYSSQEIGDICRVGIHCSLSNLVRYGYDFYYIL